ncbi:MAG: hypothetical protein KDB03_22185, partial [Planctomycetales bacterium]|nr:hypothetical protein [Planctomycetales bacterium]
MTLDWDPEIDSPATIAIVGGGPIGVESALYARFLGYDVLLCDNKRIGDSLLAWGDRPMPCAWSEATTSLGLAALEAQGTPAKFPDTEFPPCRQYVENYLLPVARTDLIYDSVVINAPVRSISRISTGNNLPTDLALRAEQEFRLLVESQNERGQFSQLADIVLDCTGNSFGVRGLATGGGLAIGEREFCHWIHYGKLNLSRPTVAELLKQHCVIFGDSAAACANVLEMSNCLAAGRITWVLPKYLSEHRFAPDSLNANLSTSEIDQLQQILKGNNSEIAVLQAWGLEKVHFESAAGWNLTLQTSEEETLELGADQLIVAVEQNPDWRFAAPLQLNKTIPENAPSFFTPEPHYYVLGSKSGANSLPSGIIQIRELFSIVGG